MMPVQDNKKVIILVNVYRSFSALTEIVKFVSLSERRIAGRKVRKTLCIFAYVHFGDISLQSNYHLQEEIVRYRRIYFYVRTFLREYWFAILNFNA
jgi:hypothetical protein